MKELFSLLFRGRFRALFIEPTHNGVIRFFRYAFVGGIATVVDWVLLWACELGLRQILPPDAHAFSKYPAAVVGFGAGLMVNFWLTRAFVFNGMHSRAHSRAGEFGGHLIVGVIGLVLTELLLLLGDVAGLHFMLAKIAATAVVFFWNYIARKCFVYKK